MLFLTIRVGARGEKDFHQTSVGACRRNVKRRSPIDRRRISWHSLAEQCACRDQVVQAGRHRQFAPAGYVSSWNRRDPGEKQVERVVVLEVDGPHPRRKALVALLLWVLAGAEQLLHTGQG